MLSTPKGARSIYVRRCSRVAFGIVGSMAGCATWAVTLMGCRLGPALLLLSWAAALCAGGVAYFVSSLSLERRLSIERSDDVFADYERLQATGPLRTELELSRLRERGSIVWPLTVVAIIGPLSLHVLIQLIGGLLPAESEDWMRISAKFTCVSHIIAVYVAWQFPRTRRPWRGLFFTMLGLIPALAVFSPSGAAMIMFIFGGSLILATGTLLVVSTFLPLGSVLDKEREALLLKERRVECSSLGCA